MEIKSYRRFQFVNTHTHPRHPHVIYNDFQTIFKVREMFADLAQIGILIYIISRTFFFRNLYD